MVTVGDGDMVLFLSSLNHIQGKFGIERCCTWVVLWRQAMHKDEVEGMVSELM